MYPPCTSRLTSEQPGLPFGLALADPGNVDTWRLGVPAKGACYLLSDAEGRPILLATTRNLRASLVNRMQRDEAEARSKRADYAAVVRSVRWRPAFSRFEADWVHLEQGRLRLPDQYREMIEHRRVWWVHVDPDAEFPRFQVFRRPDRRAGRWFGPYPTRAAARGVIEAVEELADLCRYYEVLVKAPDGVACAYKEMGKCPAPCDGSVTMDAYRAQIDDAVKLLSGDLASWRAQRQTAMKQAASELSFERAAAIKGELDRSAALDDAASQRARPLEAFRWLAIMPGRRKGCARAFVVLPGRIIFMGEAQRRQRSRQCDWLAERSHELLAEPAPGMDRAGVERLELAAWHLMRPEDQREGMFLSADHAGDAAAVAEALERVNPTKKPSQGSSAAPPEADGATEAGA